MLLPLEMVKNLAKIPVMGNKQRKQNNKKHSAAYLKRKKKRKMQELSRRINRNK